MTKRNSSTRRRARKAPPAPLPLFPEGLPDEAIPSPEQMLKALRARGATTTLEWIVERLRPGALESERVEALEHLDQHWAERVAADVDLYALVDEQHMIAAAEAADVDQTVRHIAWSLHGRGTPAAAAYVLGCAERDRFTRAARPKKQRDFPDRLARWKSLADAPKLARALWWAWLELERDGYPEAKVARNLCWTLRELFTDRTVFLGNLGRVDASAIVECVRIWGNEKGGHEKGVRAGEGLGDKGLRLAQVFVDLELFRLGAGETLERIAGRLTQEHGRTQSEAYAEHKPISPPKLRAAILESHEEQEARIAAGPRGRVVLEGNTLHLTINDPLTGEVLGGHVARVSIPAVNTHGFEGTYAEALADFRMWVDASERLARERAEKNLAPPKPQWRENAPL